MTSNPNAISLGAGITAEMLSADPYPHYRRLREFEPVSWVEAFNMYLVTRYDDVQTILRDTENYIAGTEHSTIMDTFGVHMLTTEGELHDVYKAPLLPVFRAGPIRELMTDAIAAHVAELTDTFSGSNVVELRSAFASRLPVKTVLSLFGLPQSDEPLLRSWYDAFEKALANFAWDHSIREAAHRNVAAFHSYLQAHIESKRKAPDGRLLAQMLRIHEPRPLTDDEVRRNVSIIFFGGISTVEALILNSMHVLLERPALAARLGSVPEAMPAFLDEVVRWSGPVQSATRHVTRETCLHGVTFKPGDTVNCMIAAANRDPQVFENPDVFDIDRPNLRRHVGFAIGAHHCLGSHLAKLEASLALQGLLGRFPGLQADPEHPIEARGHEFRQPLALYLRI